MSKTSAGTIGNGDLMRSDVFSLQRHSASHSTTGVQKANRSHSINDAPVMAMSVKKIKVWLNIELGVGVGCLIRLNSKHLYQFTVKNTINTHADPSEMIPVSVLQRFHRFLEVGGEEGLETQGVVARPEYLQNIGQKLRTWVEEAYFPIFNHKMSLRREERNLKKMVEMCDGVTGIFSEYDKRVGEESTQGELTTSCTLTAPGWESKPTLLFALFNEFILGNDTNANDIEYHMFSDANVVFFTLTRNAGMAFAISESRANSKKARVTLRFDIFCDITPREPSYYDDPHEDKFLNSALIEYLVKWNINSSWNDVSNNYCMMLELFQGEERIENALLEFSGDASQTDNQVYWTVMLELYYRNPETITDVSDLSRESKIISEQDIYKQSQLQRKFVFKVRSGGKRRFIWIFEEINSSPATNNASIPRRYLIISEQPTTVEVPRPITPVSQSEDESEEEEEEDV